MNEINRITAPYTAGATAGGNSAAAQSSDFAQILTDTLQQDLLESTITASGGSTADLALSGGSLAELQTQLLASAAQGEMGDEQIMVMFLTLMMQEFEGSEMAPLLGAIGSVLNAGDGAQSGKTVAPIRPSSLGSSGYSGLGGVFCEGQAFVPEQAWVPTTFQVTSQVGRRSANLLQQVIAQFDVEHSERYRPYRRRGTDTYCNIFVWDVTRALGCEIPHYVDRENGQPRSYPDLLGAYELDANGVCGWLAQDGAAYGWREIDAATAQAYANAGFPVVAAWDNPGGIGHVQMVCPAQDGAYNAERGVTVAQSGSINTSYAYIDTTMQKSALADVRYYAHA